MATKKKPAKKTSAKKPAAKSAPAKAPAKAPAVKTADPVVHFEMPAQDRKRAAKFYNKAFGWNTQLLGEDMGNYVLATTTTEVTKAGSPKKGGIINGGFYPVTPEMGTQHPSVVIRVQNIKKSIQKVIKAGGQVLGEPASMPGIGTFVSFIDSEGNRSSMIEYPADMK
jgi:predicted enzyme related to lactoylglutathione lyase